MKLNTNWRRLLNLAFASSLLLCGSHAARASSNPYIAEIIPIPYNFAPRGFAFCHGQLLPIASNTALFSLLGTAYGGDGRTTFGLPDLRGRTPVGTGTGPGLSRVRLGQEFGGNGLQLRADQIPSHTHTMLGSSQRADADAPGGAVPAAKRREEQYSTATPTVDMHADMIGATGSGEDIDDGNMQPSLIINYVIAVSGQFPSRS